MILIYEKYNETILQSLLFGFYSNQPNKERLFCVGAIFSVILCSYVVLTFSPIFGHDFYEYIFFHVFALKKNVSSPVFFFVFALKRHFEPIRKRFWESQEKSSNAWKYFVTKIRYLTNFWNHFYCYFFFFFFVCYITYLQRQCQWH